MNKHERAKECLINWLKDRKVTTGLNKREKKEEELHTIKIPEYAPRNT